KGNAALFEKAAKDAKARGRGAQGPVRCVAAVRASVELPFEAGLARERELLMEALSSTESAAMRHGLFAQRHPAKSPDVPAETPTSTIKKAAVLGAGTMGGGIAMVFANAGIPVVLLDREQQFVDKGISTITGNYAATVKKGRLSQADMDARVGRIT